MNLNDVVSQMELSERPITHLIHKSDSSKIIAIGLKKGVSLNEHKSPGPANIVVIKGAISYKANSKLVELRTYDEFQIPIDEIHSVTGIENAVFLLVVG
ncbi:MAG: hypothetical protein JXR19_02815 [Bacteroidia bacterium]